MGSLCPNLDTDSAAQQGFLFEVGGAAMVPWPTNATSLIKACAVLGVLVHLVNSSCPRDILAVYKIRLETFWSEERFPKQYPQWRPPAQWSKTVGFTHPAEFQLFQEGSEVGEGVRHFVERADSDTLEREAASWTFLDSVLVPPIGQGVGEAETLLFLDGNHSQVSVVTKIVPSPDWFVGLSSVELCHNGGFIKSHVEEAFPLDAGTDNGFTFTSPNWETEPRGEVFQITNRFPNHPAGSFNYPHLPNLPSLALFTLEKQREYQLIGDAPHQRERDEQITKFKYSLHEKPDDSSKLRYSLDEKPDDPSVADAVVEFVPVDFEDKMSEGDTPKLVKEVSEKKSASEEVQVGGKITDAGAAVTQLVINGGGKSGRINKLNFTPVGLVGTNKTGLVQQILSNDIPALDLMPGADMFFNSTSDKFISFLPIEVTRRKVKGGIRRQRLKSDKKMKEKEEELMKLLMAVENMNAAETRATIIARNREKRRRRKEMREREKLKMERLKRQKKKKMMKKENSVLPPDGFHASNSQKNFMKKKYYSREPQKLNPVPLPEEKKSSLYSQILASYNKEKSPEEKPTRRRRRRQHRRRRKPRNCKVSSWGQWSDCNKSCGIGEAERRREVVQRPVHGGVPCPALVDYKWCGSARNCKTGYFNW